MLTADTRALRPGVTHYLWVLELDLDYGRLPVYGRAGVHPYCDGRRTVLASDSGHAYTRPVTVGDVELWTAEDRRWLMAVFPCETAMRDGGRALAAAGTAWLPRGVREALGDSQPSGPCGVLPQDGERLP